MRTNKKGTVLVIILISLLMLFLGCISMNDSETENGSYEVTVTKIIDGDTITVSFSNGSTGTIRFLGIDCPETMLENNHVNEYQNITNLSCLTFYGLQAKQFVSSLLNNSQIFISFDNHTLKKDTYDRYLCYVTIDEMDVNARLIEEGYARVYTIETFSEKAHYLQLQQEAISQSKGLWGCTYALSDISIDYVHYNAVGNDEENLNDEYIVLVNNNQKPIDLSGWSIRDNHGNQFDFPLGFYLNPETSVTVYTGLGTNITTALYWNHGTPVWNNDGDTVKVYNEKNIIVATFSY